MFQQVEQLHRVFEIGAEIRQTVERVGVNRFTLAHQVCRKRVGGGEVDVGIETPCAGFNAAAEQLRLDNFIRRRYANRFGNRQRQQRMPAGRAQLREHIPQQVFGGQRAVVLELTTER